jgi:hypothetical protein
MNTAMHSSPTVRQITLRLRSRALSPVSRQSQWVSAARAHATAKIVSPVSSWPRL